MTVAVVNPNASELVTGVVAERLRELDPPIDWVCLTNAGAPEAIETAEQLRQSEQSLLATVSAGDYEAIVVAGFGDPGVALLRRELDVPVAGIGSAALFGAACYGRFGVLTVKQDLEPLVWDFVRKAGYGDLCAGVSSVEIGVLSAARGEVDHDALAAGFAQLAGQSARTICLGSGSFAPLISRYQPLSPVPLIDGIGIAVTFVSDLLHVMNFD